MNPKFYINNVIIERITNGLDANNLTINIKSTVHTTKGLIQLLNAREVILSDKQEILAEYRLFIPNDFTILDTDILLIDGKEYSIYSIDNILLNAIHQELLLKKYRA